MIPDLPLLLLFNCKEVETRAMRYTLAGEKLIHGGAGGGGEPRFLNFTQKEHLARSMGILGRCQELVIHIDSKGMNNG
jgi:hypothetical protein